MGDDKDTKQGKEKCTGWDINEDRVEQSNSTTETGKEVLCSVGIYVNHPVICNDGDVSLEPQEIIPSDESHKKTSEIIPSNKKCSVSKESMVYYCGSPVGTIAAMDPSDANVVNYDQVFIRDFIPSGIAFLLKGEYDIVRNFILHTLQLQSWERTMDCYSPGQGLMPASFKVRTVPLDGDDSATEEVLDPDFGEAAIGRVAPVDSG